MIRSAIITIAMLFTQLSFAQGLTNPPQQSQPTEAELKEKLVQQLTQCAAVQKGTHKWEIVVLGSEETDMIKLVNAMDAVASVGLGLTEVGKYHMYKSGDTTVRKVGFTYNFDYVNVLKKSAEARNDVAMLDRIATQFSIESIIRRLIEVDGVSVVCVQNADSDRRSFNGAMPQRSRAEAGVIGSN